MLVKEIEGEDWKCARGVGYSVIFSSGYDYGVC